MPEPEHDLEIPPFPIEELLTAQDRADIKACAEDLVSSTGEEPVYLSKPQMDERLESLRGFKGSFLETDDPLAAGEVTGLPASIFVEKDGGTEKAEEKAEVGLFEELPAVKPVEEEVAAEEEVSEEEAGSEVAAGGSVADEETETEETEEDEALPPPIPEVSEGDAETRPDRRVSLVFFGAGLVAVGALWALVGAVLFMAVQRVAEVGGNEVGVGVSAVVWCGAWAVAYLVLGFGNVLARRWARALTVVVGWVWMAVGVLMVVAMGLFFTELTAAVGPEGALDVLATGGAENVMVGLLGGVALMAIFVPGIMVLYGSAPSVRETCERLDVTPGWTDRRSLGMLVFGGVMACVAFWYGALAARDGWFLWYNSVVDGLGARQVYAGACGAALVVAVLTLDMRRGIWWVLLVGVLAGLGVMAGPWVAVLFGEAGGLAELDENGFSAVKTGGLVVGVWAALLVFVLMLRRCLPKKDEDEKAGEPVAKGA